MRRGKFITIEGQDGAGKSTNAEVVEAFLQQRSIEFVRTREPGGTPFAERIRRMILESHDRDFGDQSELLLIFAARADHIKQVIEPALSAGIWVLCDRFTDATFAYQGGGRGLPVDEIRQLQRLVQGGLSPDLTLLLDVPVALGERRAGQRGAPDRFERQQQEFKQRVRDAYLALARGEAERVKVIDADANLESVASQIHNVLSELIDD